jgi:hypothetical protein
MNKNELLNNLLVAEKYFTSDKHLTQVSLARQRFTSDSFKACEEIVKQLPTSDSLLAELMEKLKGKSIFRTLKKIHENKDVGPMVKLKGLSSLITHTIIEMEHGRPEYGILLPMLLEKEQELLYEL